MRESNSTPVETGPRKYTPAAWTTLTIPISTTINNPDTEDGKKWASIMRPMRVQEQSGFFHGLWGRVIEAPETVWFVTAWETMEALQAFDKSPTATTQLERMTLLSSTAPSTIHCDFTGFFWDRVTKYTGVMDVHFAPDLSPSTRQEIESLRGLRYFMTPGRTEPRAMNGSGVRGLIQEPAIQEGQETVVMRFIDFWMDKKKADEFKKTVGIMWNGSWELVWDNFLASLEEKGMMKMTELHSKFQHVPTHFYGTEEEDRVLWWGNNNQSSHLDGYN